MPKGQTEARAVTPPPVIGNIEAVSAQVCAVTPLVPDLAKIVAGYVGPRLVVEQDQGWQKWRWC